MTGLAGYDVEHCIGRGSTATVWRARSPEGRVVALKRVVPGDLDAAAALRREADVLASLHHPNVVRLLEVVCDNAEIALVTEYAPGGSLAAVLRAHGPLPSRAVAGLGAALADALEAAHRLGVVHRDVKPANVLFAGDGTPKLADFGLCCAGSPSAIAGTAAYLAPEVAEGVRPTERSDVYALGAVCYEALTGRPPYDGASPLAVLRAASRGDLRPVLDLVPDADPRLAAVIARALQREPARRHPHAAALSTDLRGAPGAAGPAKPAAPPTARTRTFGPRPPRPPEPPARAVPVRLPLRVAAVALCLLVLPAVALRLAGVPADASAPGTVTYHDGLLEIELDAEFRRLTVGQPGDLAYLGDWGCDGRRTLGLYRPDSGELFVFDAWPEGDEAVQSRLAAPHAAGCDVTAVPSR